MSRWDGEKVVGWEPYPIEGHPGWWATDCGCCNGIQWSAGTEPMECPDCNASGARCIHLPSRSVAEWPGGPFLGGHADDWEIEPILKVMAKS